MTRQLQYKNTYMVKLSVHPMDKAITYIPYGATIVVQIKCLRCLHNLRERVPKSGIRRKKDK
uniref:Uncharacterized protein n=1 Tax=Arundo donax TaxID=35708 RepID=A0A0A9D2Y5_ARUDO